MVGVEVLDDLWVGLGPVLGVVLRFWWCSLGCLGAGVGEVVLSGLYVHYPYMKSTLKR